MTGIKKVFSKEYTFLKYKKVIEPSTHTVSCLRKITEERTKNGKTKIFLFNIQGQLIYQFSHTKAGVL